MYATSLKCGDIVARADEGRQEVEIIGGGAEEGPIGIPEETTRKHTRDMLNSGGGLGQEKPEEAAVETTGEEAEADGGVGLGKEVGQRTSDNQVQETAGEGAEADKGIGLGKEAPK